MSDLRLYAVSDQDTGETRLVDATSQPVARNHVVGNRYKVWLPTSRETAQIMATGVKPETAGVPAEQSSLETQEEA